MGGVGRRLDIQLRLMHLEMSIWVGKRTVHPQFSKDRGLTITLAAPRMVSLSNSIQADKGNGAPITGATAMNLFMRSMWTAPEMFTLQEILSATMELLETTAPIAVFIKITLVETTMHSS